MSPSKTAVTTCAPFPPRWIIWALLIAFAGCDSSPAPTEDVFPEWPVTLTAEWTEVLPSDAGIDTQELENILRVARGIERLKSVVAVKNGAIVLEEYLHGAQREDLFDVRSATKSITSALVGLAIEDGTLPGLDATVGSVLGYLKEDMSEANKSVTVEHLLTMGGGWEVNESSGSYQRWFGSADPERWLFEQPRNAEPGAAYTYNSAGVHLLGVMIDRMSESTLIEYADRRLFTPAGIIQKEWEMFDTGYPNAGAGIKMRSRDLARFGQLFLQNGRSGSRQVLPEAWVEVSTRPAWSSRSSFFGPLKEASYGYLWRTDDNAGDPIYFAWGWAGQIIYVKPSLRAVVVVTTDFENVQSEPGGEPVLSSAALNLIHSHVVPAMDR